MAHDGTLSIPTAKDELYAAAVNKYSGLHENEVDAKVINQGYVELDSEDIAEGIEWAGKEPGKEPETAPDTRPAAGEALTIDGTTYNSLKAVYDAFKNFDNLKTVTISTTLDMSLADNKDYASYILAGKDLVVDTESEIGLRKLDGSLSLNTLTVKKGRVNVGSGKSEAKVMLTVNSLVIAKDAYLSVYDSYIKVNGKVGDGGKTGVTNSGTIVYVNGGLIVADNLNGEGMLVWNKDTNKWGTN